jgi:flagellar hook-length control protein FliK
LGGRSAVGVAGHSGLPADPHSAAATGAEIQSKPALVKATVPAMAPDMHGLDRAEAKQAVPSAKAGVTAAAAQMRSVAGTSGFPGPSIGRSSTGFDPNRGAPSFSADAAAAKAQPVGLHQRASSHNSQAMAAGASVSAQLPNGKAGAAQEMRHGEADKVVLRDVAETPASGPQVKLARDETDAGQLDLRHPAGQSDAAREKAATTLSPTLAQKASQAVASPLGDGRANADSSATQPRIRASADQFAVSPAVEEGVKGKGLSGLNQGGGEGGSEPMSPAPSQTHSAVAVGSRTPAELPVATGGAGSAASRTPTSSVGQQMMDSIHATLARGERQVVVRLEPPELGTVVVRFQQQGDEIQGLLEVTKTDTRQEVEQALPQLLRGLEEIGVQVRRLEVAVGEQPEREAAKEQLAQDPSSHQQDPNQTAGQAPESGGRRWSEGSGEGKSLLEGEEPAIELNRDRIDMLV